MPTVSAPLLTKRTPPACRSGTREAFPSPLFPATPFLPVSELLFSPSCARTRKSNFLAIIVAIFACLQAPLGGVPGPDDQRANDLLRKTLGDGRVYERNEQPDEIADHKEIKLNHAVDIRTLVVIGLETGCKAQKDLPDVSTLLSYGFGDVGKFSVARIKARGLDITSQPYQLDVVFITERGRTLRTLRINGKANEFSADLYGPFLSRPEFTIRESPRGNPFEGRTVGTVPAFSIELAGLEVMVTDKNGRICCFAGWPGAPSLPSRRFENPAGKIIEGKVQSILKDSVRMQVNGESQRIALDKFSEPDRTFLLSLRDIDRFRSEWGSVKPQSQPK